LKATSLLADWAEAINGKISIPGAAWNRHSLDAGPLSGAVAVRLIFPSEEATARHNSAVHPLYAADNTVEVAPPRPAVFQSVVELGSPVTQAPGEELLSLLTVRFLAPPLPPGKYQSVLEVDGNRTEGGEEFDVVQ